jgi:hypothetical protein
MKYAVLFLLASCSAAHQAAPIDPEPIAPDIRDVPIGTPPGQVVAPPATGIEACLLGGGELVEVDSVDNNDREDHGALLTFGISNEGLLAAAGADGTLKFWTLDAELLATVDGSLLTYGSEEGRTPITDLTFFGENVLAGDIRGLVAQMSSDGSYFPVAGTTPDIPIRSVAFHAGSMRLAHAQVGDVVPLVVRKMDGPESWEIAETLDEPNDLAFAPSGELFVVGVDGGRATIEVREAADPTAVLEEHVYFTTAPIAEVAFARSAPIGAAVSTGAFYVIRDLAPFQTIAHGGTSVDLSPPGAFAFTVGSEGRLAAISTESGDIVADVAVASPVKVRVDATGTLVLVGSEDAIIHVFSCAAP